MSMLEAVASVFQNYVNFSGRARRSEYWFWYLFNNLLSVVVGLIYSFGIATDTNGILTLSAGMLTIIGIYGLVMFLPTLAVNFRRLHDTGHSGAYILILLIPLVGEILYLIWMFSDGTPDTNQYGPDPKGRGSSAPSQPSPSQQEYPSVVPSPQTIPEQHTQYLPDAQQTEYIPMSRKAEDTFYLQCIAGEYQGRRIPVHDELVIGRGPECGLTFSNNTRGISRTHCKITIYHGTVYITDLQSKNGTYVNSMQFRMPPNQSVAIEVGDTIFLTSEQQALRVCRS